MKLIRSGTDISHSISLRFNDLVDGCAGIPQVNPGHYSMASQAYEVNAGMRPKLGFNHESQKVEIGLVCSKAEFKSDENGPDYRPCLCETVCYTRSRCAIK